MKRQFTAFGMSGPTLDEKYVSRYQTWLERGYFADMDWMVTSAGDRLDVRRRFPWVKSVLVGLDNYYSPPLRSTRGLRFSRYALGLDYHILVREKLETALTRIRNMDPQIIGKVYVDSGPIMEKAYAEQAGLGWIGKNGVFIAENIGSYCFIGIILLSVELPIKSVAENRCGDCTACLERCPGGAIVAPGMIDARRCLSYLTVEKRGDFSEAEAQQLRGWVYGCDVCQEVCPWNIKWQQRTSERRYIEKREAILDYIELGKKINMDKFKTIFGNSAVERLKYERLKRNVKAALKNMPKL